MKLENPNSQQNYSAFMDLEEGWVSRRIFHDQEIFDAEMRQIFARAWLFVAHESQLPNVGDFLTTQMGKDAVIVSRHRDNSIKVFLNSCTHRGNRVSFVDAGNAKRFVCNYHGWAFDTAGSLMGMNEEVCYSPGDIDKSQAGLKQATVSSYKGLVFATFDPNAPSLEDFLGDYRWYLDIILDNDEGGTELIGGCIKSVIPTNWKFGAENFIGDAYHATWAHDSGFKAMNNGQAFPPIDYENTFHASANGSGHEFGLDGLGDIMLLGRPKVTEYYLSVLKPRIEKRLGELRKTIFGSVASATVFPNVSYLPGVSTFRTWIPRSPFETELRTWVIVNRNMPDEIKREITVGVMQTFGPGGVFEMDDGENWEGCTAANRGYVTRNEPLHYRCGIGRQVTHPELPGIVYRSQFNDANQRGFYRRWADLMNASSWADVPDRGGNRLQGHETRDLHNGLKSL